MKKTLAILFMCVLCLVGCGKSNSIENVSANLNTYTLEIDYNKDHTLNVKQTVNYKNTTGQSLENIKFCLYPTAFKDGAKNAPVSPTNINKAYPNGLSYGGIQINKLNVAGKEVTPAYEGDDDYVLVVKFDESLKNNNSATIEMEYVVTLPNVNHRFGYGNNTINIANFYPIIGMWENGEFVCTPYNYNGDPFYSDVANYNVTINAPKEYKIATTGKIVSQNENNDLINYQINAKAVRDFAFVLSDKFEVLTEDVNGVQISYFYYEDEDPNKSFDTAKKAITLFSDMFGKYPYETFNVVQTNFVHGGMEFPNLVYISDEVDNHNDYLNVIIHETAHQWWYGLVGSNAYNYGWLDEGLTEFSTLMFYEEYSDYGINTDDMIKNTTNSYVTFVDLMEDVVGKADTTMNRNLSEYDTESEYVYMSYIKGMLFYNNLREIVGEDKFVESLKQYVKDYSFKVATPEDMIKSFEKVCKMELENLLNSWINGNVVIKNVA